MSCRAAFAPFRGTARAAARCQRTVLFTGLALPLSMSALGVKNGSVGASSSFPLYPTKQTSTVATARSVSCHVLTPASSCVGASASTTVRRSLISMRCSISRRPRSQPSKCFLLFPQQRTSRPRFVSLVAIGRLVAFDHRSGSFVLKNAGIFAYEPAPPVRGEK